MCYPEKERRNVLGANPARSVDIDDLAVGTTELELIKGTTPFRLRVAQVQPPHGGGALFLELLGGGVHVFHHEAQVVDAGIAGNVPGRLSTALIVAPQDGQVDIPVGKLNSRASLTDFLQFEHCLVKCGRFFRVWRADGDVLNLGHGSPLNVRFDLYQLYREAVRGTDSGHFQASSQAQARTASGMSPSIPTEKSRTRRLKVSGFCAIGECPQLFITVSLPLGRVERRASPCCTGASPSFRPQTSRVSASMGRA